MCLSEVQINAVEENIQKRKNKEKEYYHPAVKLTTIFQC